MSKDLFKKIILLITYTLVLGLIFLNIGNIAKFIWNIIKLLSPLWVGLLLAFILNVPMSALERRLFKKKSKKSRILSILLSLLIIVILILLLVFFVIPDFIDSISYLLKSMPKYMNDINKWLNTNFKGTSISELLKDANITSNITSFLSKLFQSILKNFSLIISNTLSILANFITGLIIAVYFLYGKEDMLKKGREVIVKIFDEKIIKKLDKVYNLSKKAFHDFIAYQCLECVILGVIMYIAFVLFRFPYAMTIAFLTGVTAIIPIFGAWIACIVGAILIATKSISKMIIFIIVFTVVQQIENNLIYPHVVGKHVGLPPILTILAIIVGGKVGGIYGILIFIPLTAVINTLFWGEMKKDLPKIGTKKKKDQTTRC